jgi:hypothetical protein
MQGWIERVPLRLLPDQPQFAELREPLGEDELSLQGIDTRAAVQLLDSLCHSSAAKAGALSASDRDGILAALYRALWGDRIVSTLECEACGAAYDLSFELSTLQRQLGEKAAEAIVEEPRVVGDGTGQRYHLPSADEEQTALGIAEGSERLRESVCGGGRADDLAPLSDRLEALAPLIDIELDVRCAECSHPALARFDIQSFALQRLLDERESILDEIHILAQGYGWPLREVLSLPRSLRRSLVQRFAPVPATTG